MEGGKSMGRTRGHKGDRLTAKQQDIGPRKESKFHKLVNLLISMSQENNAPYENVK